MSINGVRQLMRFSLFVVVFVVVVDVIVLDLLVVPSFDPNESQAINELATSAAAVLRSAKPPLLLLDDVVCFCLII